MKALTYHGPHHVRVENVPDPIIEQPDDIILRVTATAICGSDLHLYRGKIPKVQHGDIFGHEFMGEIVECGAEVKNLQKGDRVVIPFVIACGDCFFCRLQQYAACENTNVGQGAALHKKQIPAPAALFGYSHLYGGVPGGQAEYVRVPKGNVGPFKVPQLLSDDKALFLSDILPTAWQAAKNAQIEKGSSVAVFGAGPVGLLTIACARLLGAEQIEQVIRGHLRNEFGTTLPRFDYLAQLSRFPKGLRMKTLSEYLMVTGGNVTGLTDQLVAEGWVERVADEEDRRSMIVRLTRAGKKQFSAMAAAHESWLEQLLEPLGGESARDLYEQLGKLRLVLNQSQAT